jgi:alkylhydroperoxidase family enzyme
MLRALISKKLDAEERRLGVPLDYLRHILRVSLRSFFTFARIVPIAEHRKALPPAPYHVARLVATRAEDCGTCLQIEVNLARRDGVPAEMLRAVLERAPERLADGLADAYRFAEAVVTASGGEDEIRPRIVERWGERGLVELALGIAVARFFPATKRALGHATSCALVEIDV